MALQMVEKDSNGVTVLELSGRVVLGEESSQLRTRIKELLEKGKDRKSTRLNSSHIQKSRMPSSA